MSSVESGIPLYAREAIRFFSVPVRVLVNLDDDDDDDIVAVVVATFGVPGGGRVARFAD